MQNSPARSSIDVGSVIAGTYTIEALVGRGGMGAVFLASHNRLPGKKVAIKVIHADLGGDEINARFKREAQIASLLSHPNIVHIEDYNITSDGMPYLVLEYLQGESLSQRLRRGPMSVEATFPIIRQVGSALAAAHAKGIVHRDLKPQNIFLITSEIDGRGGEIAKVLDFGISKMRDSQTVKTQDTALLGTPQYMAPEQATGQHDKVDERTDVFALGAIVYEMLSGEPAFSGQSIPEVVFKVVYEQPVPLATRVPALPTPITATVERALAKKAEERFPSVTAFLEALTGTPISLIRNPSLSVPPPPDPTAPTSASGRTPNSNREAFERTMASGDHRGANVPVDAATVDSYDGRTPQKTTDVPDGLASTIASSERSLAVHPTRSKRTPLIIGGVLVAAVAAAGIAFVALREPPRPPSYAGANQPAEQTPIATKPTVPQVEKDLLEASATHVPVDAGAPPTPPPTPPTQKSGGEGNRPVKTPKQQHVGDGTLGFDGQPTPDSELDANDDSRAAEKLKQAFTALNNKNWIAAGEFATGALTAEDMKRKHEVQARMILGVVACHTNDVAGQTAALRALEGRPKLLNRVRAACSKASKAGK